MSERSLSGLSKPAVSLPLSVPGRYRWGAGVAARGEERACWAAGDALGRTDLTPCPPHNRGA
jgi:hypothetical protein